ncbi:hypothetical protein BgiMline_035569 [Biomphalaria glabrata]|uniref:Uncharacterized protein LOC106069056 n=1 Tax=Biomphalaria glabrata TaxID=6526 RepID=A0A9W2Z831_BIOGL|nr:uncharacterized protein LOC106069056 [Biomphalaria glabrata]XP_055871102.1 uncharacterized protein LOC106069056 [Biomphalaria glabrata]KAI8730534.1 hypothetical protein BgiMline_030879 [Biomphalaria glabrata]KAI8764482.1 hypothetical protein BgiBS90_029867 [Biomphalaria glabrata]
MLCPIAIVCSVLLLSLDHVRSEELCPPALEGSQYNLSCTGSALGYRLNAHSFIYWIEKNSSGGGDREITLCSLREACDNNYRSEFSVTNRISGQSFTSLLTFHKVTDKHRNKTLVCKLFTSNTTVRSCKMAVFQPGTNTGCTANLNNDGKINLRCFSHDVYPGISCQYSEYINSLPSRLNQTMSKSSQKMNGKNLYFSECETSLFPLVKGNYEYRFLVVPDYQIQGLWNFTSKNSVKVAKSPKVDIDQVETSLCPGVSSVRVVCSVDDWFGTKPLFRFSLLGKTLNSEETSQNGYKYKMTYDVPIKEGNFKALMNCTVGYNDSGGAFRWIWDTKHLNFYYPPKPPVFTNTALPTLSQILDITQGQNMTIECQALDGFPKVSFINVTCMSKGRVIYTNVTNSNRLPVVVYGNDTYNGAFCVCQAKHKTDCYNGTGGIIFRVRQLGQKRDGHSSDTWNKMTPVYYIIIAVLILIFLPIILGTCVFIRKHGAKLYDYYYGLYRRHTPVNGNRGSTRLTPRAAPPLPPPRVPPRPSGYLLPNNDEAGSHPVDVRSRTPSNEEGWMKDNDPVYLQSPEVPPRAQQKRLKRRKRRRKVHATPSDTSADYLIPFPRRLEATVSDPTEADKSLTQANNSDYLSMNCMNENFGEASLGFAPLAPLPMNNTKRHPSENTEIENTGTNSVTCEAGYIKLDGKGKKRRKTGQEASAGAAGGVCEDLGQQASESVWVDTSMSDVELDFNGESDGSDQSGSRKDFLLPQDGGYVSSEPNNNRVLGPSSLMLRAVREQNVYVESSIY